MLPKILSIVAVLVSPSRFTLPLQVRSESGPKHQRRSRDSGIDEGIESSGLDVVAVTGGPASMSLERKMVDRVVACSARQLMALANAIEEEEALACRPFCVIILRSYVKKERR